MALFDRFRFVIKSQLASADYFEEVVLSDTINFKYLCRSIHVSVGGVIQVVRKDDEVVKYTVYAGQRLDIRAKRINLTDSDPNVELVWEE